MPRDANTAHGSGSWPVAKECIVYAALNRSPFRHGAWPRTETCRGIMHLVPAGVVSEVAQHAAPKSATFRCGISEVWCNMIFCVLMSLWITPIACMKSKASMSCRAMLAKLGSPKRWPHKSPPLQYSRTSHQNCSLS